jgi:hypothetical protein
MTTDEMTPLAVLLQAMRLKWLAGDHDAAAALARIAAPFVHARPGRAGATVASERELQALTDAQLETLLDTARTKAPPDHPQPAG